jgi:hypothetical protein
VDHQRDPRSCSSFPFNKFHASSQPPISYLAPNAVRDAPLFPRSFRGIMIAICLVRPRGPHRSHMCRLG